MRPTKGISPERAPKDDAAQAEKRGLDPMSLKFVRVVLAIWLFSAK
jgi:hypothetical protein